MWPMATSSGSGRTAPKGRATPPRNARGGGGTFLTPTIQWILVVIAGLLVLGAVIYVGSDVGRGGGGIGQSSIAATAVIDAPAAAA